MNIKSTFIERASKALMHSSKKKLQDLLETRDYERMQRVIQADRMLLQWRSDTNTAKALVKYYTARGDQYSLSSAYRDINYAKQIFGSMRMTHKDYERYMLRETIYKWLRKWEVEPGKEMACNAAIKNLIVLGRLDKEDEEGIDRSLLGKHPIIMSDDVSNIGLERDPRNAQYVDSLLSEYFTPEEIIVEKAKYKANIIDVEFEIIEDDKEALP